MKFGVSETKGLTKGCVFCYEGQWYKITKVNHKEKSVLTKPIEKPENIEERK